MEQIIDYIFSEEAAQTTSGTGPAIPVGGAREIAAQLIVAQARPDSTLNAHFETSTDKLTWSDIGVAFTETATTGSEYKALTTFGKFLRVVWTITGQGFTFAVKGTGKTNETVQ